MGHTTGDITTHYSAADLEGLLDSVEKVANSRATTALRTGLSGNVVSIETKTRQSVSQKCSDSLVTL